jgi:hypothetical protein
MEQAVFGLLAFVYVFFVGLLLWLWERFFNMVVACALAACGFECEKAISNQFSFFASEFILYFNLNYSNVKKISAKLP